MNLLTVKRQPSCQPHRQGIFFKMEINSSFVMFINKIITMTIINIITIIKINHLKRAVTSPINIIIIIFYRRGLYNQRLTRLSNLRMMALSWLLIRFLWLNQVSSMLQSFLGYILRSLLGLFMRFGRMILKSCFLSRSSFIYPQELCPLRCLTSARAVGFPLSGFSISASPSAFSSSSCWSSTSSSAQP